MTTSGYTTCPRCGELTVSSDDTRPELCLGCDPDGAETKLRAGLDIEAPPLRDACDPADFDDPPYNELDPA